MVEKRRVAFILRGLPGLGHVSPAFAIAERLAESNIETHFITYANGVYFLKKKKQTNIHEVSTPNHEVGMVPWKDMFEVTTDILPLIKKIMPDIVLVDGEFDAFFLLKRLGIEIVMITTSPYVDHNFGKYSKYADYAESAMKNVDLIIVHGIDKPKKKSNKMVFVGPLVRKLDFGNNRKLDIIPICIGFEESKRFLHFARLIGKIIRSESLVPRFIGSGIAGAKFESEPLQYFYKAQFIVTHGGMATIEEAAVLGIPMMLLCDNDQEKRLNALSAENRGLGVVIDIEKIYNNKIVKSKIKELLNLHGCVNPMVNGVSLAVEALFSDGHV
jgi:UDP-N-acetylglucosamine:LPS N-acetylglucosamine transferase